MYEDEKIGKEDHLPLIHDNHSLHLDGLEYVLSLLPNHYHCSLLLMTNGRNIIDEVEI